MTPKVKWRKPSFQPLASMLPRDAMQCTNNNNMNQYRVHTVQCCVVVECACTASADQSGFPKSIRSRKRKKQSPLQIDYNTMSKNATRNGSKQARKTEKQNGKQASQPVS